MGERGKEWVGVLYLTSMLRQEAKSRGLGGTEDGDEDETRGEEEWRRLR